MEYVILIKKTRGYQDHQNTFLSNILTIIVRSNLNKLVE
jgi:hypothetical protein